VIVLRVVAAVAGLLLAFFTVGSAIRTVVLPRGIASRLTRVVFVLLRSVFRLRIGRMASFERRDRIMALYGPIGLLVLLVAWLTLVVVGYTGMFWAVHARSLREAFTLSGSSVFTLGFRTAPDLLSTVLAFTEAALGLVLLALLITYLPSIYQAFSRREQAVALLEVRAGSPPSGVEMIERFWRLGRIDKLVDEVWIRFESWFVEIEESHTSFPVLAFFRSPQPDHSWITAAGAVLDGAALITSTVDQPRVVEAQLTIRAGYVALRRIADFYSIPYDPDPSPNDPISVKREEFDAVYDRLAALGVPLKSRDEGWEHFSGWRVNYDTPLVALSGLLMAPEAPWSSDRGGPEYRVKLWRNLVPHRSRHQTMR
jgi:hypothetical protein